MERGGVPGGVENRHEEARLLFEESLQAALALGSKAGIVFAKNQLGLVDDFAGDLDEAGRRLGEALALARAEGSRPAVAAALSGLGFVAEDRGELEIASGYYRESLTASRENGDRYTSARALLRGGSRPGPGRRERLRHGPPGREPGLPGGFERPGPGGGHPRPDRPRRLSRPAAEVEKGLSAGRTLSFWDLAEDTLREGG